MYCNGNIRYDRISSCQCPANWRSQIATVCWTCARNIVFQYKINFCVDDRLMVCFPCVWLCIIWVHIMSLHCIANSKWFQISTSWTQKNPEHTLAPICWCYGANLLQQLLTIYLQLTHWGRTTHICVSKLTIIASDNGLSPGRRKAIIWNNAGIFSIGLLWTNLSEIFNRNSDIFFQENALENVVCEIVSILSRPQWVKP